MPLAPGGRLGFYEIVELAGAGGMGEVYRARDLRLGRTVALKILPAEVDRDAGRASRFEREARAVAAISHPNIVTLHSVEEVEGTRFLVMEFVEGQSLEKVIGAGGLPMLRLVEIGISLAGALAAAHERGVIHRDLKPSNVMIQPDGRIKVLDFGLAKLALPDQDLDFSKVGTLTGPPSFEGQFLGTLPYMAPEQVRGEAVDPRTDLFALGVVLYEMASGERPFIGASRADLATAILRDTPRPLSSRRPGLPADLERIIARCLEKNAEARIRTALDVRDELRRLRTSPGESVGEVSAGVAPERIASIAVLPFVNRSGNPEDAYFSDGLTDELLAVLSRIRGLRVTARTSSFFFRDKDVTLPEIGRALNVATVLEGSVRKAGDRARISVQLVNTADSSHLWSETYDRTLEDIFAVQDEIAQSVVRELGAEFLGEGTGPETSGRAREKVARAARGRGVDPDAHHALLMARHMMDRNTAEDTVKAIGYLRDALGREPGLALAWAELGWAYSIEADRAWSPYKEGYARARAAVARALSLDPDLPAAHSRMGWIQTTHDWDFRGARESFARAVALAPGDPDILRRAGVLEYSVGHLEKALDLNRRSLELDPLNAGTYQNYGQALHAADRLAEADVAFRKAMELTPQRAHTRAHISLMCPLPMRADEALAEARREPEESMRLWALGIIHHGRGEAGESDAALRELTEKYSGDSAFQIAEVLGARGEIDPAFDFLEHAYQTRDGGLHQVIPSPHLRSLHGDPRWGALLSRMGLNL